MFSWTDYEEQEMPEGPAQISDRVFLGDIDDSLNVKTLKQHNIGTVISFLDDEDRNPSEKQLFTSLRIKYIHFQVADYEKEPIFKLFKHVNHLIQRFSISKRKKSGVLLHCYAGISRSPTMALYYLASTCNMSLDDAIEHLKSVRPIIDPNDGFMQALVDATT